MRCKVNNAVIVKKITPKRLLRRIGVFAVQKADQSNECGLFLLVRRHKTLDKTTSIGIIIFTGCWPLWAPSDGETTASRSKAPKPASARLKLGMPL